MQRVQVDSLHGGLADFDIWRIERSEQFGKIRGLASAAQINQLRGFVGLAHALGIKCGDCGGFDRGVGVLRFFFEERDVVFAALEAEGFDQRDADFGIGGGRRSPCAIQPQIPWRD